jgi:hypothetical protein
MRFVINIKQPSRIDAGIDLCGREARMAKQFLNGAQITAAAKQMRGKGMAKCVRGGSVGKAETGA